MPCNFESGKFNLEEQIVPSDKRARGASTTPSLVVLPAVLVLY